MFIITLDNLNSNSPSTLAYKQPILPTVEEIKRRNNIDRILQRRNREQHLENMREYYQDNKEKYKEQHLENMRKYCQDNKETYKERNKKYNREYYLNNKEYFKEYYQKHKQQYSECFKEWYEHNSEKHCARFREWYQKNKEKLLEYRKEYYKRVEVINCGCGMHYKKYNRKQHEITRCHQKWEEESNNS